MLAPMAVLDTRELAGGRDVATERDVPDAVKPPPGNPRFPLIDGVRALAVLAVLGFHAAQTWGYRGQWWGRFASHLDVGVTVFFVLSGFLLYRPFVAARLDEAPRPRVGAYARRRVLRIVPAYWLALTLLAIYPGLAGVFTHDWWVYYGFLQIYRVAWEGFFQGLVQAWSLCTEVAFYVALPLFAACVVRLPARHRAARIRNELVVLGLLSAASLWFRSYVHAPQPFPASEWLPGMFDWFAVGMVLAVASAALAHASYSPRLVRLVTRRPVACWAIAVALFMLAGALDRENPGLSRTSDSVWLGEHLLYGGVALFAVLPAVFGDEQGGLPRRLLANPIIAWLGLVSYGIFLWHVTILSQLNKWGVTHAVHLFYFLPIFLAGLAVSAAIAAISYYAVERPLLRLKEKRLPALIALPVVFLLVLAVGIGQGQRPGAPPTTCLIVRLYQVDPAGCRPAGASGRSAKLLARSILTEGRQLPIVPGWIVSRVDLSQKVANGFLGNTVRIVGWAASARDHRPASSILVFSSGRFLGAIKPTISRPDVAKALKDKALERSGYVVELPVKLALRRGKLGKLQLVGVEGTAASFLPFDCKQSPKPLGC
jgi:peptidoglycan/LPS O-acetylase OafA/YrhL